MTADLLARARGTHALLDQEDVWLDADGKVHEIVGMSASYRDNVARFLEARAGSLEFFYSLGEIEEAAKLEEIWGIGEMAGELRDREFEETWQERLADPLAWIRSTPLLKALRDFTCPECGSPVRQGIARMYCTNFGGCENAPG